MTEAVLELFFKDPGMIAWWGTSVECTSALARLERDGHLSPEEAAQAHRRLDEFSRYWVRVEPLDVVLETARRLLRIHPLRAADSLQLAAALHAAERTPSDLGFICFDDRLGVAARQEGFPVLNRSTFTEAAAPTPRVP